MTHPAIAVLGELAAELRALLARVGAEADGAWQGSWSRCQELFTRYRAEAPELKLLAAGERERLTAALDEVVRLNAVAAGLVARETERLSDDLRRVATAKRRARGQSDAPDTARMGGYCDMQG